MAWQRGAGVPRERKTRRWARQLLEWKGAETTGTRRNALVGDFSPDDFKNNVLAMAEAAKYFQLPTILTTSFENGPLVPELKTLQRAPMT